MTKKEFLRQEVLKLVQQHLKQYGFTLNKQLAEFTKKNENGWIKFYLIFLERNQGWEINPTMQIRFNVVEDIFHKTSGFDMKYQKGTPTIGSSAENYLQTGYGTYRFALGEEEDIEGIVLHINDVFENMALPFYEKFIKLEEIERAINRDVKGSSLTGGIFVGSKGIILAKLLDHPNYEELRSIYMRYYEKFADGFYLPSYMDLVKYLDENNFMENDKRLTR